MNNKDKIMVTVFLFSLFVISLSYFIEPNTSSMTGHLTFSPSSISQGVQNLFDPFIGLINGFFNLINSLIGNPNSKIFFALLFIFSLYYLALSSQIISTIFGQEKMKKVSIVLSLILTVITYFSIRIQINSFISSSTSLFGLLLIYFLYGYTFYLFFRLYSGKGFISDEKDTHVGSFKFFLMMLVIIVGSFLVGYVKRLFNLQTMSSSLVPSWILLVDPLFNLFLLLFFIFGFIGVIVNLTHIFSDLQYERDKEKLERKGEQDDLLLKHQQDNLDRQKKQQDLNYKQKLNESKNKRDTHNIFISEVNNDFNPVKLNIEDIKKKFQRIISLFSSFQNNSKIRNYIPKAQDAMSKNHMDFGQWFSKYNFVLDELLKEYSLKTSDININKNTISSLISELNELITKLKNHYKNIDILYLEENKLLSAIHDYLNSGDISKLEFIQKHNIPIDELSSLSNDDINLKSLIPEFNTFQNNFNLEYVDVVKSHEKIIENYNNFKSKYSKTLFSRLWESAGSLKTKAIKKTIKGKLI